jgi:hypothetical protein
MKTIIRVFKTIYAWFYNKAFYHDNFITENEVNEIVNKEFNHLSRQPKHGNQDMWSFDLETRKIEKVALIKQSDGNYRGFANPDYPSLWAINKKNAIRKFSNHGYNEKTES